MHDVRRFVDQLRARTDCWCEDGLSSDELAAAQARFGVRFPPLWRSVLRAVHPVAVTDGTTRLPDWRMRRLADTVDMVVGPLERLLDAVETSGFWPSSWGTGPDVMAERLAVARTRLATVPLLTPLWDDWYVGDDDLSPVFRCAPADLSVAVPTLRMLVSGEPILRSASVQFWSDVA